MRRIGRTASITIEEARGASPFPFADLYAGEMRPDAARARRALGWRPGRISLPEDVARGSYAMSHVDTDRHPHADSELRESSHGGE